MPLLKYLADTNVLSAKMAGEQLVLDWLEAHETEVALSTLSIAEIRRGIELKQHSKKRRELEREFRFLMEDFAGCIWVFDEAAAFEWGRLLAEAATRNRPLPFADSLIGAIARSMGAKVLSSDKTGFAGCVRVDPGTGLEHSPW
jgi:predicted nucleic acid-binding protein